MSDFSKFLPGRRLTLRLFLWLISLFLAAYCGGYWALRKSEVFSFEYPINFLDGTLCIKNANPTLTRNNAGSYDPIAEVHGWSIVPPPEAGIIQFFSPAILLESRFQKNVVSDEAEHIHGELSHSASGAALRSLLRRDTGLDCAFPTIGFGKYWHHKADGWGVSLHGGLQGIDSADLIKLLRENPSYIMTELKTQEDFRNYAGQSVFTGSPAYHFGHTSNDEEYRQGWLLFVHESGMSVRYTDSYSDS